MTSILLIDDNECQHELFRCYALNCKDIDLGHALNIEEASLRFGERDWDMTILDNRLTPYSDYRQTLPLLKEAGLKGKVVLISSDTNQPIFEKSLLLGYNIHQAVEKSQFSLANFGRQVENMVLN